MKPGMFKEGRRRQDPIHLALADLGEGRLRLLLGPHRLLYQHDPKAVSSLAVHFRLRHGVGIGCIVKEQDPLQTRDDLVEEFQTFRTQLESQIGHPRDVAARPGEALDQAQPYGVAHRSEDNRDPGGCHLRRLRWARLPRRR